ncbi:MAG: GNAT family N-acetyltransferase, partial [Deltaproteobacteria bacterium]|nr:GNAT family N-acetyltransferase [Deltaproteobacteria bacterium]
GFEIAEEFRGNSYSLHACNALKPLIRKHYDKVILTADPENAASIRIMEKLGARYISEIEVPKDDPAHAGGATRKKRFEWTV